MSQIAKILTAATLLTIFSYLLIFTSIETAWNGGEYWGFDGQITASAAAIDSFDRGDYRFLRLRLTDPLGKHIDATPNLSRCDNHPSGVNNITRLNSATSSNDFDSIKLATDFSHEYNTKMIFMLADAAIANCRTWASL